MIRLFKRIKDFLIPPEPEYYQYLGGTPKHHCFNKLFSEQIKKIIEIINEELEISRGFGLELKEEDEKNEKIAILTIFNLYGQSLIREGKKLSSEEHSFISHSLIDLAVNLLEKENAYYFEMFKLKELETGKIEVKNKYVCHVNSVMSRLILEFLNHDISPLSGDN